MVSLDKTCHPSGDVGHSPTRQDRVQDARENKAISPTPLPYSEDKLRTEVCDSSEVCGKSHNEVAPGQSHTSSNFIIQYFKKKYQSWNRQQFYTIVILSLVEFFASTVVSIQAPFYPDVAREKGATATEYGSVFGIFEITVFIMSPIYGAKMGYLGPKRVFNVGILVTGICCIIFGLLNAIEGRAAFIWSCLIVRIIEAMGDAAFETASFTIIALEFPDSVATNFAILEIFYGLGLIIGPTLGGALYEIGGFRLPFLSMGGFLFASAIATYFLLPESSSKKKENSDAAITEEKPIVHGGFHMFKMLRIPVIAMTAYSIVAAAAGVGFISANLDFHLEQFELNKTAVGTVFMMNGGVYALTAPAWGWICDHTKKQKVITFLGAVFTILGFLFIGPVPYFPLAKSLPLACFGLAVFGIGLAATLVSAFLQLLKDAIKHGYADDISTYGLVSGLWASMAALGYSIGPSVGGYLDDKVGFEWASVFIIGGQVVLIILLLAFYISKSIKSRSSADITSERASQDTHGGREDVKNNNSKSLYPIFLNSNELRDDGSSR